MKRIFILIAIVAFLYGCSGPQGNLAGTINGQKITRSAFVQAYQGHVANFQSRNGRAPNAEEKNRIFDETWKNLTRHIVLKQAYKSHNIQVTMPEVIDYMIQNPADIWKKQEVFQRNGVFEKEIYIQSVRYDSPVHMSRIRREYYEHLVPTEKLKQKLIDNQLNQGRKRTQLEDIIVSTADFDLVYFDPEDMQPAFSDSELNAYYERHLDDFIMEPIFGLEYFSLPVKAQNEDIHYTMAVADSIQYELVRGKSFENTVTERQGYIPGLSLYEPGFARIESLDSELYWLLESLPDGGISQKVEVGQSFAIYQRLQRTKNMINYRALLIPPILSPASINQSYKQAVGMMQLAKKISMQEAAEELELNLVKLDRLSIGDSWHHDKLVMETVENMLLKHHKGSYLDPIYSTVTGEWLIVHLTENQVNRVRPFEMVKEDIRKSISKERKRELAEQKARQWLAESSNLKNIKHFENTQSYTEGNIRSTFKGKSLDLAYVKAMQLYLNKEKPQPYDLDGIQVVILPNKYHPNKKIRADKELIRDIYTRSLEPDWFEVILADWVAKAKVEIQITP